MSCEYRIKSPDGREIVLPATFSLLNEANPDIVTVVDALQKYSKESASSMSKVRLKERDAAISDAYVTFRIQTTIKISDDKLKEIILGNTSAPEKIIGLINEEIFNLGGYNDINSAIYDFVKKKKGNMEKLYEELSKPITPQYFTGLSMDGVLDVSSITIEKEKVIARVLENAEFGFSNSIPENLNTFVNGMYSNYKDTFEGNSLIAAKNIYGERAFNVDGFTFFKDGNDLSLFQGLFKKVASDVNKDSLYAILEEYNKSPKFNKYGPIDLPSYEKFDVFKFFNGSLDKSELSLGDFDTMLDWSDSTTIKPYITDILRLVSNTLDSSNSKLFKSIQSLFWQLTPDKYGSAALIEEKRQADFMNKEAKIELQHKNKLLADRLESMANKNRNFSDKEIIKSNLYNTAKENIVQNQDIITFPLGGIAFGYGIVRFIAQRPEGVLIYGVRKNQFGEVEELKHLFVEGKDEVTYRKSEKMISEYDINEIVPKNPKGLLVVFPEGVDQKVIKGILRKGDTINKELLVVGVHPGAVVAKSLSTNTVSEIPYSRVMRLRSEQAINDIEEAKNADVKKYVQISDPNLLTKGDLFFDEGAGFYKHILYTDAENVFFWVQQEGADAVIKSKPRSEIKKGLSYTTSTLKLEELTRISKELDNIGKSSATMSSYLTQSLAADGDYFSYKEDGNLVIGKVTDSKTKKGVIYNSETKTIAPIIYDKKGATFFTDKDISSKFALTIARVNDWNISLLPETEVVKSHKEVKYIVPKSVKNSELIL